MIYLPLTKELLGASGGGMEDIGGALACDSNDDGNALVVPVERAPEGLDAFLDVTVPGAEVDEHDLVLAVVDDLRQGLD